MKCVFFKECCDERKAYQYQCRKPFVGPKAGADRWEDIDGLYLSSCHVFCSTVTNSIMQGILHCINLTLAA